MKLALAALALVGCKAKEHGPPPDPGSASAAATADALAIDAAEEVKPMTPEQLAKRYAECWAFANAGKFQDLRECYAYEAVLQLPGARADYPVLRSAQTIVDEVAAERPGIPDLRGEPQLILVDDHDVLGVVLVTGTHSGVVGAGRESTGFGNPVAGIPASGKRVGYLLAQVIRFDTANRMASEYDFYDVATILGQVGATKDTVRAADTMKPWPATVTAITKDDAAETANKDIVDKLVAALNKHDARAVTELLAADAVWSEQPIAADWDRKGVAAGLGQWWRGFSKLAYKVVTQRAAGEYVIAIEQIEGTNDGAMPALGVVKTGKGIALPMLVVHRIAGGKLANVWVFYQRRGLLELLAPEPSGSGSGSSG